MIAFIAQLQILFFLECIIFTWYDPSSVVLYYKTYSLGSSHDDNHLFFDKKYIVHPSGSNFFYI